MFDLTLEIRPSYFGRIFLEEQAQVALSSMLLLVPVLHELVQAWKIFALSVLPCGSTAPGGLEACSETQWEHSSSDVSV